MKFKYQARNKEGELQVGFVESYSQGGAADILVSHGLYVLSLENAEQENFFDKFMLVFKRVTLTDKMVFSRQFATLLEAKVSLSDSLKNLQKQTSSATMKEVIHEITADIDSGLSLSQSLERQKEVFSEFYVSMIRSAEITGRLEEAVIYLANYLEKQKLWRSRVINALIYPAVLIVMFIGIVLLMVTLVLPNIRPILEEAGAELPWYTSAVLNSGDIIINWWWIIIIAVVPLVMFVLEYLRSDEGKIVLDEILLRTPVFGKMFSKMYIARFAESLAILIQGGIPIAQALEITSRSIGSSVFEDVLHEVSEQVRGGELLSTALGRYDFYFPPLVSQMISIGETTGRLDELLSRISTFYTREVDDIMGRLGELIQPLVIAIIGVFVGFLFASILVPIYNMVKSFGA
ncbi:MAG: Type II secretion system F domain protein [Candidatus Wolfebacteria bacterium GW2011_GWE1_48_7]|uniref:Type II secretion system F domain protein n=2 Tax=Candidatus Wolfeibacteriota TaxID=1752735 RepID=A0A0G1WJF7_9BACT|nr:MAG: type II secretion system F domain-containing protein, type IV pilus assembly protein PilC [Candidatus Wolfebacteria bacterium GW2011_GWB1_47_1]KKU37164.1 MAG: Type II secretion system F domain protein [Candidatus Wolfebacteria bacterium GW2011_GWC2_46_275]KKU42676.1 MAG: Type II secretion system F domain protein [Candidatus Wolfebacteria bacterium GW2011_GWB2_46_69]KKU54589.1 MAG: Type II secretion system F domain protein [Candidatus Wolfebacteria bacterium GW2011_GWC1_47_103]KKU59973.1